MVLSGRHSTIGVDASSFLSGRGCFQLRTPSPSWRVFYRQLGNAAPPLLRPAADHYCRSSSGVQCAPPNWKDPKLVLGGLLFGLGWALAGSCPGPMLTTMVMVFTQPSTGGGGHAVLLLCTSAGMWIADACTDFWCV